MRPSFTIGIEEEYQTVDPNTGDLRSHIQTEILEKGKRLEYDAISGAVVRAARRHGMRVPATETVYALLKLLDKSRQSGAR